MSDSWCHKQTLINDALMKVNVPWRGKKNRAVTELEREKAKDKMKKMLWYKSSVFK